MVGRIIEHTACNSTYMLTLRWIIKNLLIKLTSSKQHDVTVFFYLRSVHFQKVVKEITLLKMSILINQIIRQEYCCVFLEYNYSIWNFPHCIMDFTYTVKMFLDEFDFVIKYELLLFWCWRLKTPGSEPVFTKSVHSAVMTLEDCVCFCVNESICSGLTLVSGLRPRISSCCWIFWSCCSCFLLSFMSCRTFSPGCWSPLHFQPTSDPRPWCTTDTTLVLTGSKTTPLKKTKKTTRSTLWEPYSPLRAASQGFKNAMSVE